MSDSYPKIDVLIVGAGAAGLMAAKELAKAGKKVIILEARDRIGGRIFPLSEAEFGYPAQGGAEFVHGPAKITRGLISQLGLTFIPLQGETWNVREGAPVVDDGFVLKEHLVLIQEKLRGLEEDIPIATFLERYFSGEQYAQMRRSITRMVEGYDAADTKRISTFSLREEWLGGEEWQQGTIKEGYKPIIDFLADESKKHGAEIVLGKKVSSIQMFPKGVEIRCGDEVYAANQVIVTLTLGTLSLILFDPPINDKLEAAKKIGFGGVIKILLKFDDQWWFDGLGKDLSRMNFIRSNEIVATWWTQYPQTLPVLIGWLAGPITEELKNQPIEEILEVSLGSLASIFKVEKEFLRSKLVRHQIVNWPADPLTLGAYSYTTFETKGAYAKLAESVDGKIFFAGEALCPGKETATVEGALSSGLDVANKILNK